MIDEIGTYTEKANKFSSIKNKLYTQVNKRPIVKPKPSPILDEDLKKLIAWAKGEGHI